MDSGILMIQDSILVCSPDPRIPHTAGCLFFVSESGLMILVARGEEDLEPTQWLASTLEG
jgi:hypothetical protein